MATPEMQSPLANSNPTSPLELSVKLERYVHSIEGIAKEHGLHHDSGVSIQDGASSSKSSSSSSANKRFLMTPSGSSASLRPHGSSSTLVGSSGGDSRIKKIIESPGVTGEFDAHEDIWMDLQRKLKPFGDTLRHERLRTTLGETQLADDCVGLLHYSAEVRDPNSIALPQAQVEMMRILANLCIDHDENREKLLHKGAPQAISALVQKIIGSDERTFQPGTMTLLRTAAGALLNMQLEHSSTQRSLRSDPKTIEMLLKLATDERIYTLGDWYRPERGTNSAEWKDHVSTGSSISTWAWRIVQDVCSGDEEDGNAKSENMEKTSSSDEGEKPIESLVSIDQPSIVASLLIRPLQSIIVPVASTSKGDWDADEVTDLMESDMDSIQIATELIESCSLDSKQFRIAALDKQPDSEGAVSMLEFLVKFAESAQTPKVWSMEREETEDLPAKSNDELIVKEVLQKFSRSKAAVSRAIVCIVGEDENMTKLFEEKGSGQGGWFTEKMKEWMMRDAKDMDDLVSTAMLAVGNLARKDAHCIALVHEHHIVDTLTRLLVPNADIKVAHGTICLLKNLAIPAQNKSIIGSSNQLISKLSAFLEKSKDNVQPLQFATVGLLKHLCSANVENSYNLVLGDTLQVLLELIRRTDDVPTRMEGTRVLVNAIKSLWSTALTPLPPSKKDIAAGVVPDQADRQKARQKLTCEPVVLALAEMVKSSTKYPVLVNEGILALTLIAASMADQFTSGAIMVAKALQKITVSRRKSSSTSSNDPTATTSAAPANPTSLQQEERVPKLPQRQTTLDALASTAPNALPVLRSAADMIATVLARRDARMPPQFANNACALIQALVTPSPKTVVEDEKVKEELLSDEDPAEVLPEPVLPSSSSSPHNKENTEGNDVITSLVESWRPALEQLSTVGPQESLFVAQKALDTVKAFLK